MGDRPLPIGLLASGGHFICDIDGILVLFFIQYYLWPSGDIDDILVPFIQHGCSQHLLYTKPGYSVKIVQEQIGRSEELPIYLFQIA